MPRRAPLLWLWLWLPLTLPLPLALPVLLLKHPETPLPQRAPETVCSSLKLKTHKINKSNPRV